MTRRQILKNSLALPLLGGLASSCHSQPKPTARPVELSRRAIPKSGELLPVVGLGTYQSFATLGDDTQAKRLRKVLDLFSQAGGQVIDSSPMYAEAESVVGKLLPEPRKQFFLATKVWTDGRSEGVKQMASSSSKLARNIDLMQIHNLRDWRVHLSTLKEMKASGKLRYVGITTWGGLRHRELKEAMKTGEFDFIQVSYNAANQEIEREILPLAEDLGLAVIANRPFGQGELFKRVRGRELPAWIKSEWACETWAQAFLKFALADSRITVVIPATSKPEHMQDNLGAGQEPFPGSLGRQKFRELLLNFS